MHKKITAHQAKKLLARKTGSGGFTLVELIVVIVIMGILTAAILPMVTGYVASAKEKVAESNQHMVEQATRLYLILLQVRKEKTLLNLQHFLSWAVRLMA